VIIAPGELPVGGGLAGPPPTPDVDSRPVLLDTADGERTTGRPLEGVRANRESDLFWHAPAVGAQERIAPADGLEATLERWRERMRAHAGAACLHLAASGASQPEAALYALPFVPAEIARERERFGAYATRTMGGNLLADLVQEEVRKRERIVAIDAEGVLMCAFASRVPFQLLLAPRTARARFEDDGPVCAELLRDGLQRLERRLGAGAAVQLWVRTAPRGAEHFGWRIDVHPVLRPPGGLEAGAGIAVNPIAPERAAAELRDR
jgi:UDPglucose--hexose-1-phosphate uridylyltransferase